MKPDLDLDQGFSPTSADFRECTTCSAKPGSPILCAGCLNNRALINYLLIANAAQNGTWEPSTASERPTSEEPRGCPTPGACSCPPRTQQRTVSMRHVLLAAGITPCSDGNCIFRLLREAGGMHSNGGCRHLKDDRTELVRTLRRVGMALCTLAEHHGEAE